MLTDRTSVASSNVASIGYDEASETLEVEFHRGGIYQYYNVPRVIFDEMMAAPSIGQFVHSRLKNVYPFSRVG